jgi:AcrR family transcriptional regulator
MRAEGLERVTMRRLATELDTGPASLYVYVENMAELHGALLDELLASLPLPAPDAGDWRAEVVGLLGAYTETLHAYPSLARSVMLLRPAGPHYLRLIEVLLGLLEAGGVPVRQAAWGVDLLLQLATATAAEHGTRKESGDDTGHDRHQTAAVHEAAGEQYPHLARVRDELFTGTGRQRFRWAFTALLDGITTTPAPIDMD